MQYNFKKVHTGKDLVISIILIAAGAGLFFVSSGIGIVVALCGVLALLFYKTGYRTEGGNVLLVKQSEDLCQCCRSSIVEFLNGKDVNPEVKKGNAGGIIRLDTYFNKEKGVAYAQLFDYYNYHYEPATEVVELQFPKADKLISQL